jgi:hypothetical protein
MIKNLICFDEKYINLPKSKNFNFFLHSVLSSEEKNDLLIFSKNKNSGVFVKKKFHLLNFIKGFLLIDRRIELIRNIFQIYSEKILRLKISDKKYAFEFTFLRVAKVFFVICCYFEFFSKKSEEYDNLINLCYYNSLNLAAIFCFKVIKNKAVIDIQHGYIGKEHPAYSSKLKNNYLIPNILLLWKNQNTHYLKNIFKLKYLNYPLKIKKKNTTSFIIGISLQTFPVNQLLLEIINNFKEEKKFTFFFKRHPMDVKDAKLREDLKLIRNQKNVKFSSKDNIVEWLSNIDLHITHSSSVIIEAAFSKIPTVTFEKNTLKMYQDIKNIDNYLKYINLTKFEKYLKSIC